MNFSWFVEYPDWNFSLFSSLRTCEIRDDVFKEVTAASFQILYMQYS